MTNLLPLIYLIASVLFVIGLKMLSGPKTAKQGNLLAAAGMVMAIIGTIFLHTNEAGKSIGNLPWIVLAIALGTAGGWISAKRVQMTAMPEMVSLFNGMGGACAALISLMEYPHNAANMASPGLLITITLGLVIGTVSFSGSIIAYLKLNGTLNKNYKLPLHNVVNLIFLIASVGIALLLAFEPSTPSVVLYVLFAVAFLYGISFVLPIGGADMPVVISLLNSFTGVAAAFGGFLYGNQVMLTGGILVGSAGTLLTIIMCNAMNRSLTNVIFGSFGAGSAAAAGATTASGGTVKSINVSDLAMIMNYAKKVIVVPGYGLAVAQAQHIIHELELLLEERGVEVKYAIHPVAGRMPGHMNVLLAESNVAYDKLCELEEINPEFASTDVVLVVGANDVVNPSAKNDPSSPIYGMPVLDVENAKNVVVIKRSMGVGYAGIDNVLFGYPNCYMLFADAKAGIGQIVAEVKAI